MWPFNLSVRLPIVDLVGRYPANYLIGREPILKRIAPLISNPCESNILCGISVRFQTLSPSERQVTHALLTRPPLIMRASSQSPLDLHVLGVPPAFVLSQDQTLNVDHIKISIKENLIILSTSTFLSRNRQGNVNSFCIVQFSRSFS